MGRLLFKYFLCHVSKLRLHRFIWELIYLYYTKSTAVKGQMILRPLFTNRMHSWGRHPLRAAVLLQRIAYSLVQPVGLDMFSFSSLVTLLIVLLDIPDRLMKTLE